MRTVIAARFLKATGAALLAGAQLLALAQAPAPETKDMVEALKPRTRSLRNLIVGEAPASAPATASAAGPGAAPATATAAPALSAPPEPRPSLSMAIRFDFDSARLRPEGAAVLDRLATALQTPELKDSRFLIEGHTDAKGNAEYNLRLSQARADEVRRHLAAQGVAESRLSAVGRGAQEPANAAAPLAAENRRVRIVNIE